MTKQLRCLGPMAQQPAPPMLTLAPASALRTYAGGCFLLLAFRTTMQVAVNAAAAEARARARNVDGTAAAGSSDFVYHQFGDTRDFYAKTVGVLRDPDSNSRQLILAPSPPRDKLTCACPRRTSLPPLQPAEWARGHRQN